MPDLTAEDLAIEALAAVTQLGEMQRQIEKWQAKHKALVDEIRRYTQSKVV